MRRKAKKFAVGIGVFLFWMAVWEVASLIIAKSVILPSPPAVLRALFGLLKTKSFYIACGRSVGLIFVGLAAGTAIGVILAVLSKALRLFGTVVSPAVEVIKATPVASVIIVLLFVLSKNIVPMLAAALMVIPIIFCRRNKGYIEYMSKPPFESCERFYYALSLDKLVCQGCLLASCDSLLLEEAVSA